MTLITPTVWRAITPTARTMWQWTPTLWELSDHKGKRAHVHLTVGRDGQAAECSDRVPRTEDQPQRQATTRWTASSPAWCRQVAE